MVRPVEDGPVLLATALKFVLDAEVLILLKVTGLDDPRAAELEEPLLLAGDVDWEHSILQLPLHLLLWRQPLKMITAPATPTLSIPPLVVPVIEVLTLGLAMVARAGSASGPERGSFVDAIQSGAPAGLVSELGLPAPPVPLLTPLIPVLLGRVPIVAEAGES